MINLSVLRHISQMELYALAFEDPLTHTHNRNMLNEVRAYFDTQALIVVMVDIDNLKHLNDHFGHDAGDKRIRHIADQLKEVADDVLRLGGDEFLLISKHSIDKALSEISGISYGERVKSSSESLADAMKIADTRMYENKRNRKTKAALNEVSGAFGVSEKILERFSEPEKLRPKYDSYLSQKGEEDGGKRPIGDTDEPPV